MNAKKTQIEKFRDADEKLASMIAITDTLRKAAKRAIKDLKKAFEEVDEDLDRITKS
jgi:hypothetical protein